MTLEAVSAVLLAALFLDESITASQAIGGAAILSAALLVAWLRKEMEGLYGRTSPVPRRQRAPVRRVT
jgi:drug/metabolite transporter (DMT)-like permease